MIDENSIVRTRFITPSMRNIAFYNIEYVENDIILSGHKLHEENLKEINILRMSGDNYENIKWWKSYVNNNLKTYHVKGGLVVDNENAYICGYGPDIDKSQTSDGNYWSSAKITATSLNDGQRVWGVDYHFSEKDDKFFNIQIKDNELLAFGVTSASACASCDESYYVGNALVAKINKHNGDLNSYRTFGNIENTTEFKTSILIQNEVWTMGSKYSLYPFRESIIMKFNFSSL